MRMVVDNTASKFIPKGTLERWPPVAVTRACGHEVAYLPGFARRRIADLYPGAAKTDAHDA